MIKFNHEYKDLRTINQILKKIDREMNLISHQLSYEREKNDFPILERVQELEIQFSELNHDYVLLAWILEKYGEMFFEHVKSVDISEFIEEYC